MMSPIRLALIGLSKAAKTSWAAEGHLPYLLSERGKQRYKIVALLNSSEDAAKRAIEHYDLGSDVKAYDSAQALAADPDVDLVACTTRVDVHYDTIRPSIEAGKAVYVEWPLAENVQRAKELAELAKAKKAPSIVGLQGRVGPVALKIQQLLRDDVVGKVLSSEVRAFATYIERGSVSEGLAYFLEKEVGGNPVTIAMGHSKSAYYHRLRVDHKMTRDCSDRLHPHRLGRVQQLSFSHSDSASESDRSSAGWRTAFGNLQCPGSRLHPRHTETLSSSSRRCIPAGELPQWACIFLHAALRMGRHWRKRRDPRLQLSRLARCRYARQGRDFGGDD